MLTEVLAKEDSKEPMCKTYRIRGSRSQAIEAFRLGYDEIPKWFVDAIRSHMVILSDAVELMHLDPNCNVNRSDGHVMARIKYPNQIKSDPVYMGTYIVKIPTTGIEAGYKVIPYPDTVFNLKFVRIKREPTVRIVNDKKVIDSIDRYFEDW